jgi:hypothetical protein
LLDKIGSLIKIHLDFLKNWLTGIPLAIEVKIFHGSANNIVPGIAIYRAVWITIWEVQN